MKLTVIIGEDREEEIIIYARKSTELIKSIEELVRGEEHYFTAQNGQSIKRLTEEEIFCFTTEGGKVYAYTEKEKHLLKMRLYAIEEKLSRDFIKINQSTVISIKKIHRFDVSVTGTLKVIMKNGFTDYVSRRQIKNVKERLGL